MRHALLAAALWAALASPVWADSAVWPDPTITPGAVRTVDSAEICSHGTRELRHWDRARDDRILAEYGLPTGPHPDFEIDHLIPLGIGGADADANLWPEPRRSVEPTWNAERKDRLEWRMHDLICSGALDVREAQRAISEDWIEAYGRFFRARIMGSFHKVSKKYLPLCIAEFQFRYNNRENEDIFGTAIKGRVGCKQLTGVPILFSRE